MPLVTSRWYDIPLRAALVATLVAIVVTLSNIVGPRVSGVIALFPAVFTSLILILTPRIGGAATAAVLANGQWGLIGFGLAIVVLHLAAQPLGRAAGRRSSRSPRNRYLRAPRHTCPRRYRWHGPPSRDHGARGQGGLASRR